MKLSCFLLTAFAAGRLCAAPDAGAPARIDRIAQTVLSKTGIPSASLAVVEEGRVIYAQAYGMARLETQLAARPDLPYSIGSISKQFAATAVLLLQEEGRLSLDDKVAKWLPRLTRASDISLRQVLSMTSGYRDYAPQDYMVPEWVQTIDPAEILARWAEKPLDFEPGSKWQYSNTNYVIAGLIVEKASGQTLVQFLRRHILKPLNLTSAYDSNSAALPLSAPQGYFRRGLGDLRPAPHEGPGWMYAAGELAMTASDVAKWDISLLRQSILRPTSYRQLETETLLNNGAGTGYGLGMAVTLPAGRRLLEHSGEVSGFTAENMVLPEENFAVVVLTNQDASPAASAIAGQIMDDYLRHARAHDPKEDAWIHSVFDQLRMGRIDRSLFTANCNAYFTAGALADYAAGARGLGDPTGFEQTRRSLRGGMIHLVYEARFASKTLVLNIYQMPDRKFEQFLVEAKE